MKFTYTILFIMSLAFISVCKEEKALAADEIAILTSAPEVPPTISRKQPAKVIVKIEAREEVGRLADGVKYTFWTFGGHVPGPFIRVRVGDLVEVHLSNHPSDKMPHNIDMHAVTGPGGGAVSSFTAPGHTSIFSFRALNPGVFVYHCATAPVGMHIANGMYGLIQVVPEEGLSKVDHEYYVMQGEFYTKGKNGQSGLQPFSMEKALHEQPEYVVFNGSVGALNGDQALPAKVGDSIRLYIGNGGPNLTSSFHVIGEIFDKVHQEAGAAISQNVQTTVIPPGGAAIAELKVQVPGTYLMVDHAIFRAFNKGALGQIKVTGKENKDVYSGKISDEIYLPEGGNVQDITAHAPAPVLAKNKNERIAFGARIFKQNCIACHQENGQGISGAFPPLAKSDFLNKDVNRAIRVVSFGLTGKVKVNGAEYNGVMPAWQLSDEEIANVLTYIFNTWGNSGKEILPEQVKNANKQGKIQPK